MHNNNNADFNDFPTTGFVRGKRLLPPGGPLPFSRSQLYEMVRKGTFPSPVKLSSRITAWRVEDIRNYIASPEKWEA